MPEFTGERVIPGLVDADLFNEHLARYKFAARFLVAGSAALDLGCGTGYGSAELSAAGSFTGADISAEAVAHAEATYGRAGVRFIEAGCDAVPLPDASCGLITAFEVIEHLEDWRGLLREARRLLGVGGRFVVSTPNKAYYAETRAETGPDPFHVHEFEYAEFESALYEFFPHVRLYTQNHAGAIVFAPATADGACLRAEANQEPAGAHFFVAVCSLTQSHAGGDEVFAWIPDTGNVLRARETHIAKLEGELRQKDEWLERSVAEHAALQREHERTLEELLGHNRWAEGLVATIAERDAIIVAQQKEAAKQLEGARAMRAWVSDLEGRIAALEADRGVLLDSCARLEHDLAARTEWAQGIEAQLGEKNHHVRLLLGETDELRGVISNLLESVEALKTERARVAQSRWMRLGNAIHVGPVLTDKE